MLFEKDADRSKQVPIKGLDLDDPALDVELGAEPAAILRAEIDLLAGAGEAFNTDRFLTGMQAPLFFGSALNNFGVQSLLDALVEFAPAPLPRPANARLVSPSEEKLSAFVFKIQANMDPNHRDRVAFMRICSGKFERGMKAHHVRLEKLLRLGRPTQFLAQDRSLVDEAVAGDIIGVHDPGVFRIGDTVTEGENIVFTGIPIFAPEHFARVILSDPLHAKRLNKALDQLSEEGAVQVFRPTPDSNEKIIGVVGALQFDVVKYRVEAEYGVRTTHQTLPFNIVRWMRSDDKDAVQTLINHEIVNVCYDRHDNPVLLLDQPWKVKMLAERHPKVVFLSTSGLDGGTAEPHQMQNI